MASRKLQWKFTHADQPKNINIGKDMNMAQWISTGANHDR
jgi:hypothetical protein